MRKVWNFIKGLLVTVWVIIAIITTILLISYNDYSVSEIGKKSIFVVDSDRLEPDFNEGDLLIVTKTSENKYKKGDNAFFYLKNAADKVFINYGKIEDIEVADHAADTYTFEGETKVSYTDMIGLGTDTKICHGWGNILGLLESKWGFMFFVILPTIFAIVYEIYSIIEEAKSDDEDK